MLAHAVQQQPQQAQPLVEARLFRPLLQRLVRPAVQDAVHLIVGAVFVEQVVVDREVLGDLAVLQILADHVLVHLVAVLLAQADHVAQVRPAPGGDKGLALRAALDLVEVHLLDVQIGEDRRVRAAGVGVLLPDLVIRLHVDALEAVPGDDVELPHGVVVLRRVAGGHDDPALRHPVAAEDLVLQKLQHGGSQGLADAVDLVEKENALLDTGGLHHVVDAGDDLAHGVLADRVLPPAVGLVLNEGEAQRALPGVVGHGIAHEPHAQFLRDLLHDGGLTDARRSHQEDRPLLLHGDAVSPELVLGKIRPHGDLDLFFGLFDVHGSTSFARCLSIARL